MDQDPPTNRAPVLPHPAPEPSDQQPFTFGEFSLCQLVRQSPMSLLYRGVRIRDGYAVAVKICADLSIAPRFLREIEHTRSNKDSGIISILVDARTADGRPYYVTRWVSGGDFGRAIQRTAHCATEDQAEQVRRENLELLLEICRVVSGLHGHKRAICHRDLKPSNILIEEGGKVVLIDLGLARADDDYTFTGTGGDAGGTPGYRAPEWLGNKIRRGQEAALDVYALAVILVLVLTGQRPAGDDDPRFTPKGAVALLRQWRPKDRRFDLLVEAGLAEDPLQRPAHAGTMRAWLAAILSAKTRRPVPAPKPVTRTGPGLWLAASLMVVAVLGGLKHFDDPNYFPGKWSELQGGKIPPPNSPAPPQVSATGEPPQMAPPKLPPTLNGPQEYGRSLLHLAVSPTNSVVRLVDVDGGEIEIHRYVVPDSGRGVLENLVPGHQYRLEASHPGRQDFSALVVAGENGANPAEPYRITLDYRRGEVFVVTSPAASVDFWQAEERRPTATAGPDGQLHLRGLKEGDWNYSIRLADYHEATGTLKGLQQGHALDLALLLRPKDGQFTLTGHPSIRVLQNGKEIARAGKPFDLPAGRHDLEVAREGFRTESLAVVIPPGKAVTKIAPDLVRQAGSITVKATLPPGADAFFKKSAKQLTVNGLPRAADALPLALTGLGVGEAKLELRAEGFHPASLAVPVVDGKTAEAVFELKALPAQLLIACDPPDAEVFLEGRRLGTAGSPLEVASFADFAVDVRAKGRTSVGVSVRPLEPRKIYRHEVTLPAVPIFPDLQAIDNAQPAPLVGLAPGSREAQERQLAEAKRLGYALETRTRVVGMVFRLIPGSTFTMGSPPSEQEAMIQAGLNAECFRDETPHQVTLSKASYIGKFEVTQAEWRRVMGKNPSHFQNAGDRAPVENVSWEECQEFLRKLCELEGVPPGTYRLLTEAEWEHACRAGTSSALYNGDIRILGQSNAPALDPIAWYAGNSAVRYAGAEDSSGWKEKQVAHGQAGPQPVGGKLPNAFGLHDMIGNVLEWCHDFYGRYPDGAQTDPVGADPDLFLVIRGGSWSTYFEECRSTYRSFIDPGCRDRALGLRLLRTVP